MDDVRRDTATLDPQLGVTLIAERAVAHVRARSAALDDTSQALAELLRTATHHEETHLPRVAAGSLSAHLELLVRRAARGVVLCLRGDWVEPDHILPVEREVLDEALARGVRFRVLVDEAEANRIGDPLALPPNGLEWRRTSSLPLSMLVADTAAATLAENGSGGEAVRTTHPALVAALAALCESQWEHGASFGEAMAGPTTDTDPDHTLTRPEILSMLAAGHTDDAIARAAGMSVRKVVRIVGALRRELDCETRFQMGVKAARRRLV